MAEKAIPSSTVAPTRHSDKAAGSEGHAGPRQPSLWKLFPWLGIAALSASLLSVLASMGILLVAQNSPVDSWSVWKPNTWLSVVASAANVFVHVALSEGINIAWWYRASKEKTTVRELHNTYLYGNKISEALLSGRNFNIVAAATIIVSCVAINGPILQRSVTSGDFTSETDVITHIPIAMDLAKSNWPTALYGGGDMPAILTPGFTVTAGNWLYQIKDTFKGSGCDGQCNGTVLGNGFEMTCTNETLPYFIPAVTGHDGNLTNPSTAENYTDVLIFNVSVNWNHTNPNIIEIVSLWKPYTGCSGQLIRRNCTLSAAVVEYPVLVDTTVTNATISILDRNIDALNTVVSTSLANTAADNSNYSFYGGVYLVLRDKYSSTAEVRSRPQQNSQEVVVTGTLSNYYASYDQSIAQLGCGMYYSGSGGTLADPMVDILKDVRQLSFMTALDAGAGVGQGQGSSAVVSSAEIAVPAVQTKTMVVFFVHWLYYGLSVMITALCAFAVAPTFVGWWVIQRPTTLSPIETARAFNAPGLGNDAPAHAAQFAPETEDTSDMLDRIGRQRVRESMVLRMPVVTSPLNSPTRPAGGLGYFFPHPKPAKLSKMTEEKRDG